MAIDVNSKATPGPLATVQQYVDAFNRGDVKAMTDASAVPASILDGMPPHVWQGTSPAEDWYRDVLSTTRKEGASDFVVTLGEPLHADTTGDSAYIVLPATMSFRVRDKQIRQSGSTFTVALRKLDGGWRITAWAWAKGFPSAAIPA